MEIEYKNDTFLNKLLPINTMKKGFKTQLKTHLTTARLVGIVTLALAILAQVSGAGSKLLFLAATVILVAPTKYCQERLEKLAATSLKTTITTTLYEGLFWALFLISGYAASWKLKTLSETILGTTTISQQAMMNQQTAQAIVGTAQEIAFTVITLAILLFIFNLLSNTLSRSLIWSTLTDEKWTKKYYLSFLKLNAAWWALWLIPFGALTAALSKNASTLTQVLISLIVIATYFTFFVHTTFLHRKKVGASITHGIAQGIGKFYHLLVPLSFALIIYVIAYQALRAAQFLPPTAVQPIMIAFALLYFSWLRAYVYATLPDFSKE